MSAQVQFDMFSESAAMEILQSELIALKESHHAVRKKMFAQQGEMMKIIQRQQDELDFLKVKLGLSCYVKSDESHRKDPGDIGAPL